jgi:ABC-type nitrate/sulfonate/bicarbonate transport system substrate-binding protein
MPGLIILLQALMLAVSGPPTSPEYLPIRVAEAEGYFAAEGLAVTVRTTRAESGAAEALAQGQADLAATTLEAILRFGLRATSTQSPRLIFGLTAAPQVALLVAGPHESAVRSIEDLSAMRVGVTTPGAPEHAWFGWLLARSGMSIAQVRVRSLGERGLVSAIDSGDVHVALVPEPAASQLLSQGRAKLLADFRTPRAAASILGSSTVNAAVFTRAERRAPDRDLAGLIRALRKAEQRIHAAEARDLAGRLPTRVVGDFADFEARLAASRGLYLPDGHVSADQLQQTIAIIRAHTPLPQSVKIPKPEDMLLQIKPSVR